MLHLLHSLWCTALATSAFLRKRSVSIAERGIPNIVSQRQLLWFCTCKMDVSCHANHLPAVQTWTMQFWWAGMVQQTGVMTTGWSRTHGLLCGVTRATLGLPEVLRTAASRLSLCMSTSNWSEDLRIISGFMYDLFGWNVFFWRLLWAAFCLDYMYPSLHIVLLLSIWYWPCWERV